MSLVSDEVMLARWSLETQSIITMTVLQTRFGFDRDYAKLLWQRIKDYKYIHAKHVGNGWLVSAVLPKTRLCLSLDEQEEVVRRYLAGDSLEELAYEINCLASVLSTRIDRLLPKFPELLAEYRQVDTREQRRAQLLALVLGRAC